MTTSPKQDDSALLIHAYLDGELDSAHALEIEQRLSTDPALAADRDRIEALRRLMRERLVREPVPATLVARVATITETERQAQAPTWRMLAAAIALAVLAASGATWSALQAGNADRVAEMVVASHIRALMAPLPVDVASSDRHTVKPWFNGRISQSPRVVDLANQGFPLAGGRIDVVDHTPAPALIYRRRQHVISLTAVPVTSQRQVASRRPIAGYNLVTWTEDGSSYWAVSDLGVAELETFAKAFRDTQTTD